MDFKKVTVGFFAAVMAMTSVCFADPETPVTTDVPVTEPFLFFALYTLVKGHLGVCIHSGSRTQAQKPGSG